MELRGRFLAVSRLNYPTPAKSLQTPQKNETPRKRGGRQQSEAGMMPAFLSEQDQRLSLPFFFIFLLWLINRRFLFTWRSGSVFLRSA